MFVKICGVRKYLWRAVDQHGNVLDILIQDKRDGKAEALFLQETTGETRPPAAGAGHRQLPSYQVAHRKTMSTTEHRQNKYLNNRCENSRQPTRQRERAMKGFRSVGSVQKFQSSFSRISPHFCPPRRRMTATDHRTEIAARFQVWDQVTEQALTEHRSVWWRAAENSCTPSSLTTSLGGAVYRGRGE
ncbi:DDE-type integrase/transposase/recombinase [Rhodococcus qingshengii]|uniref:DDE-type integrase/transposase/recombinase n=1 Tax=Rhodococcus qingshengii TaxID=334542 RepID=UPI0035FD2C96